MTNTSRNNFINKIIYHKVTIANEFNKYFDNDGPTLAGKIPPVTQLFESYVKKADSKVNEKFAFNK